MFLSGKKRESNREVKTRGYLLKEIAENSFILT